MSLPVTFRRSQFGGRVLRIVWAAFLGLISGFACVAVKLGFGQLQYLLVRQHGLLPVAAAALRPAQRLATPILGACLATLVISTSRHWGSKCFEGYVEAVRFRAGRIPFDATAWRTVSAAFSIATGAAIGREGVMVQFAAAVSSALGKRSPVQAFPLSKQVACGAAAAIAAAYNAPLAGVCFAFEIVVGEWLWKALPEFATASFSGWLVCRTFLGGDSLFAVRDTLHLSNLGSCLLLVVVLALCGPLYQLLLKSLDGLRSLPLALILGGFAVGLVSYKEPMVWGNGDVALMRVLAGNLATVSVVSILLCRLFVTSFCVGVGTAGGVFTPTLFAGSAIGLLFGSILHVANPLLFALLGLCLFLSAVTHAPWMAAFMAAELTGQWHLWPAFLIGGLSSRMLAQRLSRQSLYNLAETQPPQTERLVRT